jgi:hypothetical protein
VSHDLHAILISITMNASASYGRKQNVRVLALLMLMFANRLASDLSSKDCYCLIYARRTSIEASRDSCTPSGPVSAKVEALDSVLLHDQATFQDE